MHIFITILCEMYFILYYRLLLLPPFLLSTWMLMHCFRRHSLFLDHNGHLVLCQHRKHESRPTGKLTELWQL